MEHTLAAVHCVTYGALACCQVDVDQEANHAIRRNWWM